MKAKGVVEKSDVIGAIFGQTEGLLGSELDLRELQKTGRIGRIEVEVKTKSGKSEGEVIIPSALDSSETALIAATLETIERVGPCDAEIILIGVEDVRAAKRDYVMDRAKAILTQMGVASPDMNHVSEQIKESVRPEEVSNYKGMACGPDIEQAEEIILVEGRADVINLLKSGINNVVGVGGTSVNEAIKELARGKKVVVFTDGDRGGKLIARTLLQTIKVDEITMAPGGKEVEELTTAEIKEALSNKMSAKAFEEADKRGEFKKLDAIKKRPQGDEVEPIKERPRRYEDRERRDRSESVRGRRERKEYDKPMKLPETQKRMFKETMTDIVGTRAACIFDGKGNLLGKVPVAELENTLKTIDGSHTVVMDGRITTALNIVAKAKNLKFLVGTEKDEGLFGSVRIVTKEDLA